MDFTFLGGKLLTFPEKKQILIDRQCKLAGTDGLLMGGIDVLKKEVMVRDIDRKYDHPLAEIVQIASQYRCEILLEYDKYRINAKSIMGIIAFNPSAGMNVTISADGSDESAAVDALEKFLQCE